MSTTYKRIRGQDVTVTATSSGSVALTNWTSFEITASMSEDDATAAPSKISQFTPGVDLVTGTITGFAGLSEIMPDLPKRGDKLATITAKTIVDSADLLPSLTDLDDVVVTTTSYNQALGSGTYSFSFRSGGILPPAGSSG